MKKILSGILLCASFLLTCSEVATCQELPTSGLVKESLVMHSRILEREVRYSVYLPPGYDLSEKRYPVIYLLHGFTGNENDWIRQGKVALLADEAVAAGELPALIIVMPDGGRSWYINDYLSEEPYEDFFIGEFIPSIDKMYRTWAGKQFRGVAGLSMGGYGALIYAFRHPDVFIAAAAFSAAIRTDQQMMDLTQESFDSRWEGLFGEGLSGGQRITDHYKNNSILHLASITPLTELKKTSYWIDCGDDDHLTIGNSQLHIILSEKGVPHEFRMRDGEHNWEYWRDGLKEGLMYILKPGL